MTRFTLWGLAQYDNTLWENVVLPSGIDKQLVIDTIYEKSGDLYVYYQQPDRAKYQITSWFRRHYDGFERMIEALLKEYNPIENYDRYEDEAVFNDDNHSHSLNETSNNTQSGDDVNKASGNDTIDYSGNDKTTHDRADANQNKVTTENEVSAFDSGDYSKHDKSTVNTTENWNDKTDYNSKDKTTYGRTDTTTYGRVDDGSHELSENNHDTHDSKRTLHAHGNIGVTTNAQMVNEELQLRVYNLYDVIATMFENDILIQVY